MDNSIYHCHSDLFLASSNNNPPILIMAVINQSALLITTTGLVPKQRTKWRKREKQTTAHAAGSPIQQSPEVIQSSLPVQVNSATPTPLDFNLLPVSAAGTTLAML